MCGDEAFARPATRFSPDVAAFAFRRTIAASALSSTSFETPGKFDSGPESRPILRYRMRVALRRQTLGFGANFVAAELSPGDEELLLGSEAVDISRTCKLAFERLLITTVEQLPHRRALRCFRPIPTCRCGECLFRCSSDRTDDRAAGAVPEVFQVGVGPASLRRRPRKSNWAP